MSIIKKKVLFLIEGYTGFKKIDESILESISEVKTFNYKTLLDYFNINLISHIFWSDIIFIWFASKHAIPAIVLNLIFNKPLIIVAGGFDVASVNHIQYGAMRKGLRKLLGNWILSKASIIVSVSKSNFKEILKNTTVPRAKIKLIYNAIPNVEKYEGYKKSQILTVGEINEETYLRKGLDRFILLAKNMPDVQFYHIGKWTNKKGKNKKTFFNYVKSIAPKNIKFLGFLKNEELIKYYIHSKVYVQLSRHEAFGVSVVEALSYNCIPIVSNVFSLPEVIMGYGYVVNNISEAIDKTRYSLNIQNFKIIQEDLKIFSIDSRKKSFRKLLSI